MCLTNRKLISADFQKSEADYLILHRFASVIRAFIDRINKELSFVFLWFIKSKARRSSSAGFRVIPYCFFPLLL